ncbi:MAG: hypothetical protein MI864_00275 [Pseudomonadales bacterium]|nr:hypothetical protein [Pseudomonadales bacterium]
MALQFEVDSLDGIDEGQKGLYIEHEGKFRLDVTGIDPADELKTALQKEREERKAEKARADALESKGRQAEEDAAKQRGEYEKLFNTERENNANLKVQFDEYKAEVEQGKVNSSAEKLATKLTRDTARAELLADKIKSFVKVENGLAAFFDAAGVKIEEQAVIDHVSKQYPFLVDANVGTGGGATGSQSSGAAKTVTRTQFDQMSQAQRAKFSTEGGKVVD